MTASWRTRWGEGSLREPSLRVLSRIVHITIEAVAQKDKWSLTRCRGEHDECPHKVLSSVAYRRENGAVLPTIFAVLCRCDCHLRCPLGERADAPDEEWLRSCTCPGSRQRREFEVNQDTGQRKARLAEEVLRDLGTGRGQPAGEIRQQILDAAAARRAAYNTTPATPVRYKRELGATFGAFLYLLRPLTVHALAAAAAVGAYFESGVLQVILIVAAVLLSPGWVALKVVLGSIALKNLH